MTKAGNLVEVSRLFAIACFYERLGKLPGEFALIRKGGLLDMRSDGTESREDAKNIAVDNWRCSFKTYRGYRSCRRE